MDSWSGFFGPKMLIPDIYATFRNFRHLETSSRKQNDIDIKEDMHSFVNASKATIDFSVKPATPRDARKKAKH